jgi:hypothetical protein
MLSHQSLDSLVVDLLASLTQATVYLRAAIVLPTLLMNRSELVQHSLILLLSLALRATAPPIISTGTHLQGAAHAEDAKLLTVCFHEAILHARCFAK